MKYQITADFIESYEKSVTPDQLAKQLAATKIAYQDPSIKPDLILLCGLLCLTESELWILSAQTFGAYNRGHDVARLIDFEIVNYSDNSGYALYDLAYGKPVDEQPIGPISEFEQPVFDKLVYSCTEIRDRFGLLIDTDGSNLFACPDRKTFTFTDLLPRNKANKYICREPFFRRNYKPWKRMWRYFSGLESVAALMTHAPDGTLTVDYDMAEQYDTVYKKLKLAEKNLPESRKKFEREYEAQCRFIADNFDKLYGKRVKYY
ncbi:MAG: hypothetical protein FWC61_04085 [Proteobacteria bacterium]|nr:hypothetical protein [Pseudomonadota bacterium]